MNAKLLLTIPLLLPALAGASDGTTPGDAPQGIGALSAIVIDAASGKVLWSKAPDVARYPASTTKIMTGLLLAERCLPDETIVAPWDVKLVKEASMHLKPGERVKARDMLMAMMLRSANDGCYAVAVHLAGSVAKFSALMNERAKALGCTNTHFSNPNGLNDPTHYTTARDLALIAREAMKNPLFAAVVRTPKTRIDRSIDKGDEWMVNHNKLLTKDPTCEGIKTGWTSPAGHCFVGTAKRQGWRVITVVLKADDWKKDTVALYDWAFARFGRRDKFEAGQAVAQAPVVGGATGAVPAAPERGAYNLVAHGSANDASHWEVALDPAPTAPVRAGQRLGDLVLRDGEGLVQRVPLVAQCDVPLPTSAIGRVAKAAGGSGLWIGAALFGGWAWMGGRTRRRIVMKKVVRYVVRKGF